jgi:hypothetical protein
MMKKVSLSHQRSACTFCGQTIMTVMPEVKDTLLGEIINKFKLPEDK